MVWFAFRGNSLAIESAFPLYLLLLMPYKNTIRNHLLGNTHYGSVLVYMLLEMGRFANLVVMLGGERNGLEDKSNRPL